MSEKVNDYENLIFRLCQLNIEMEWIEFKVNNEDPNLIGEYISALSNSALILGRQKAYVVWGDR